MEGCKLEIDAIDELIDSSECAKLFRCERVTIEDMARRGNLPALKYGRSWIFHREQILEYFRIQAEDTARLRRDALLQSAAGSGKPRRKAGRPRGHLTIP